MRLKTLGAIFATTLATSASAQTTRTLLESGPSGTKLDLVVIGDGFQAISAKRVFRIDPGDFGASTAHFQRHLRRDGNRVTELRFTASPFSKNFSNRARFESAVENRVDGGTSRRDVQHIFSSLRVLGRRHEPSAVTFW